jgi:hypothetical protein
MYEDGGEMTIRGKKYPLLFNTAALKKVIDKYGGIGELGDKLKEDYGTSIGAYTWIIALLIEQGIALQNFEHTANDKPLTQEQVELLIKPHEIFACQAMIIQTINNGMSGRVLNDGNEEVDEVLKEILTEKNVTGAENK